MYFELAEDVALDGERDNGLGDSNAREGPGPLGIGQPHHAPPAAALSPIPLCDWQAFAVVVAARVVEVLTVLHAE